MNLKEAITRNHPDTIAVEHGPHFHHLATWSFARDGRFAPLWATALTARATCASLLEKLDGVRLDQRLSDAAKAEDCKAAARSALRALGDAQRAVNAETSKHEAERLRLAQIAPADAAAAVVDVALAGLFRSATEKERTQYLAAMAEGSDERMVSALLRLPTALWGVSAQMHKTIESNAVARNAPDEVRELEQLGEAARAAQAVLSRCVELVCDNSALSLAERMTGLGDAAWQHHVRDGNPAALAALADSKYGIPRAA